MIWKEEAEHQVCLLRRFTSPRGVYYLRQGHDEPCVLLLSQEQITPDVQAQLHQLPLEF
jgi:hypothetical protein